MDSTDRKEHPRGLSPTDRKNFHLLMESIFELYKKMPIHDDLGFHCVLNEPTDRTTR